MVVFMSLHLLILKRSNKNSPVVGSCFVLFSLLSVSQFNNVKLLLYDSSYANSSFLTKKGKKGKNFLDPASDVNRKKIKNPGPASFACLRISGLKGIRKTIGSRILQTVSAL